MSYQPGIPTGTVKLSQDYLNIQGNFQQLDNQFGVDHIPFSNNSGTPPGGINGYHQVIHFNPFSTTTTDPMNPNNNPPLLPPATPGFGQIFGIQTNDGLATGQQIFLMAGPGGAIPTRLTRNMAPVQAQNGETFLPGGLIVKWGRAAGSSTVSVPVVFPNAFPVSAFMVTATAIRNTTSSPGNDFMTTIIDGSLTVNGFTIGNVGDHTVQGWYWWAIGN